MRFDIVQKLKCKLYRRLICRRYCFCNERNALEIFARKLARKCQNPPLAVLFLVDFVCNHILDFSNITSKRLHQLSSWQFQNRRVIMPLNSLGGSTMQCAQGEVCLTPLLLLLLSASLYFSKRGAYWDRLCRDVVGRWSLVGCHARALWPNGAS